MTDYRREHTLRGFVMSRAPALMAPAVCLMLICVSSALASPAAVRGKPVEAALPSFSFSDCLALLDDDPSDVSDYVASHSHTGDERAVRHCEALSDVLSGDFTGGGERLDALAYDATRNKNTEDATPEERADVAADAARAWLAADMARKAEESASYGLTLAPNSVALRLIRDRALLRLGQPDTALTDLKELSSNPLLASETHLLKATAERETGHMKAARTDIDITLAETPDDPAALLERGIIRQRLGDPAGARSDWEQVISLAADSHEADLARQDLDVLASDPDSAPVHTDTAANQTSAAPGQSSPAHP
ncbi:tetratricopeptide repeat protein [Acetobacter oeni]|nr:tetratricopeptide repeat protein [Acetobacter oeni]MBB3883523.1 tetratricopeptide (TPR) repeat protein [Acetobacter oeni]